MSIFSKNTIIIVLLILLILSVFGINFIGLTELGATSIGAVIYGIIATAYTLIKSLVGMLFYSFGATLNKLATILSSIFSNIIDIFRGVVQQIGTLFMAISAPSIGVMSPVMTPSLVGEHPAEHDQKKEDGADAGAHDDEHKNAVDILNKNASSASQIKNVSPTYTDTEKWCYLGKHKGTTACIQMSEHDKCMSNQIYPSQKLCLSTRR